jgi:ribonuclease D
VSETPEATAPDPIELPDLGYVYVDSAAALAAAVEILKDCKVLGIDTESDSFFSYEESCCLVQITGEGTQDFVIDPLEIDDLSALGPLMADPDVVKIFHGADYDVVSMKRDFGYEVRNIFDTMIAAQATGHERFGLGDLVALYFGVKLNKRYQRHDWSSRPLKDVHLDYARYDAHFLGPLRELLSAQAEARGRTEMLAEEFELLERREWTGRPTEPDDCMRVKGAGKLDDDERRVLRSVFMLREKLAAARNRPPFKVWGADVLIAAAKGKPRSTQELRKLLGEKHHVARRYAREVVDATNAGLADSGPPPVVARAPTRTNMKVPPFTRDDEPLMARLKKWRNAHSKALGLSPAMVVNNAVLKEVAALKPKEVEDLDRIDEMRRWQKAQIGPDLVEMVGTWIEANPKKKRRGRRRRRRGGAEGASAPTAAPAPAPAE